MYQVTIRGDIRPSSVMLVDAFLKKHGYSQPCP